MELSYQEKAQLRQTGWWQPEPKATFLVKVCIVENSILIRKILGERSRYGSERYLDLPSSVERVDSR